jgi:UDP-N-acetyl-D-mannosaminuronate dehydrogenase
MLKIAVIGQGYVGLPLAISATSSGHDVSAIDLNTSVVESLNSGR